MKINENGLIGFKHSNIVLDWSGGDHAEMLEENLKKMPSDWLYRTKEITYARNSLGHRSKELKDLDLNNYILVTGCSNTEGVGLAVEDTYSHVLANKLNADYYNLALGATGQDVVLHNLVVWFNQIKVKPKAVIIQWPDFTRVVTGDSASTLEPRGMWQDNENFNRFVDLGIDLNFFKARQMMCHAIIQSMDIPVVHCSLDRVIPFQKKDVTFRVVDKARDLAHPGIRSNKEFAEDLYRHLINN